MSIFEVILRLKGFPLKKAKQELTKIQSLSEPDFKHRQDHAKWDVFNFHLNNNVKYRNWLIENNNTIPVNWEDIPILTKKDLQRPLKERFSSGYNINNTHIHNTSGSSGHPFFFAKDKYCHAMTWAIILNRYRWHGIKYGIDLQARFYGIPLSRIAFIKEKLKDTLSSRKRFQVFDLSERVLEKYTKLFYSGRFVYLNGYTSSLVLFAKHLINRNIILKEICPTLKYAMPTSEVLNDIDRETLKKGFGVPIVNEYGAAELDIIAFDWVLNDETLWVEVVDDNGKALPFGKEGRIIITSLNNKAMPFIRYEVGDIGSISASEKSNARILKSLQGRTNDIAILPSGKKSPGLTFYYISKSLLEGSVGMKEFIIKQTEPDLFLFEYTSDQYLTGEQKEKVFQAMDMYLETGLRADFERKESIERTKAGKLKHFQYLVK